MKLLFWFVFWMTVGAFLNVFAAIVTLALYVLWFNCYAWVTREEMPTDGT